jgi:hypothetical protein
MLPVFRIDVVKVDQNMLQWLYTYVASVLSGCCICLQWFSGVLDSCCVSFCHKMNLMKIYSMVNLMILI